MKNLLLLSALFLAQVPPPTNTEVLEKFDLMVVGVSSNTGTYTQARDFAALEWRTDIPVREDTPMILDFGGQQLGLAIWCEGKFTDGVNVFGMPVRWAYIRYYAEVWDGEKWTLP